MALHWIDWAIVFFSAFFFIGLAIVTKKYSRSTTDFLAANRCAGRYLLTMADGVANLGAISVIGMFQIFYSAGFAANWWATLTVPVTLIVTLTGWVIYRYRETRVLTMAQFFEVRYNHKFRVFAGVICWLSGILNFGIFPAVAAGFFVNYCHLPEYYHLMGMALPTYQSIVVLIVVVSLYFTFVGGQVTILITDFVQSLFCNIVLMLILVVILIKFPLRDIFDGLLIAEKGKSMVNPFDAGRSDFNPWYFMIGIFALIFNRLSWQGTQAFNCSAKSPHEAKMAGVLATYRTWGFMYAITIVPLVGYMIMHHPNYAAQAEQVRTMIGVIGNTEVRDQMLVPMTMSLYMPLGLTGAFVAMMFAATISTHDTYLHSWGSIFVQDIIMPLRKKPFTEKQHMWALRLSILFVGIFICVFSCAFTQTTHIFFFFAVTGAIWMGGIGAVIIGGLYTRWGSTAGAYVALISGSVIATGGMVCDNLWMGWYGKNFFLNGQEIYFFAMIIAGGLYIGFSLLGKRKSFDLDKMLHRGKYKMASEQAGAETAASTETGKKIDIKTALGFGGITKEFTRGDKFIYSVTIVKSLAFFLLFVVMTSVAYFWGLSDGQWSGYHYYVLCFMLSTSFIIAVWLMIGGIYDAKTMLKELIASKREADDDGRVIAVDTIDSQRKS